MDGQGIVILSIPKHPDWLWGLCSLLFSGYWRLNPWIQISHHV